MKGDFKIAVLGGDLRQYTAASVLSDLGWKISLWGLEKYGNVNSKIIVEHSCDNATEGAAAILLPLPSSTDGKNLNCPLYTSERHIGLGRVLSQLSEKCVIVGGRIPTDICQELKNRRLAVFDYFESENFQIKNAYTTAEAAISIAMNKLDKELRGSNIAVTGYGRISKHLCALLKAFGAFITVAARSDADIAWAESRGYRTVCIATEADKANMRGLFSQGYDVIYNTVPDWLFDRAFLEIVDKRTFIIELASAPGGVDVCAAKELNSNVLWGASLPGKYAPESAGRLIADCVDRILEKEVLNLC